MVRLILRYSCRIVAHNTKRVIICRCSRMKVNSAAGSGAFRPKTNLEPKAKQILDFWFGSGWETWSLTEYKSSLMSSWFGGSPELDEVSLSVISLHRWHTLPLRQRIFLLLSLGITVTSRLFSMFGRIFYP